MQLLKFYNPKITSIKIAINCLKICKIGKNITEINISLLIISLSKVIILNQDKLQVKVISLERFWKWRAFSAYIRAPALKQKCPRFYFRTHHRHFDYFAKKNMSFDGQNTTHLQVENVAGEICLSMNTITCNLQSFWLPNYDENF